MRVCFHKDSVSVAAICVDLEQHGAVYWHTSRPNFRRVYDLVREQGLRVIPLCARPGGDFLNFMIRMDLADDGLESAEARVAQAIVRWQDAGEPVPHSEPV
ncbi:hypothetical protein D3C72_1301320 [compost metagenome]